MVSIRLAYRQVCGGIVLISIQCWRDKTIESDATERQVVLGYRKVAIESEVLTAFFPCLCFCPYLQVPTLASVQTSLNAGL